MKFFFSSSSATSLPLLTSPTKDQVTSSSSHVKNSSPNPTTVSDPDITHSPSLVKLSTQKLTTPSIPQSIASQSSTDGMSQSTINMLSTTSSPYLKTTHITSSLTPTEPRSSTIAQESIPTATLPHPTTPDIVTQISKPPTQKPVITTVGTVSNSDSSIISQTSTTFDTETFTKVELSALKDSLMTNHKVLIALSSFIGVSVLGCGFYIVLRKRFRRLNQESLDPESANTPIYNPKRSNRQLCKEDIGKPIPERSTKDTQTWLELSEATAVQNDNYMQEVEINQ